MLANKHSQSICRTIMSFNIQVLFAVAITSIVVNSQSLTTHLDGKWLPNRTLVTVDSNAGPWLVSLNPTYDYGIHDNTAPSIVNKGNSGIDFIPGRPLTIIYVSGLVRAGTDWPWVDANGDLNTDFGCGDGLRNHGNSGTAFPCVYTDGSSTTHLMELMGVFADDNGVIIGRPFTVGASPVQVAIPSGATQLQLGINDDIFYDNSGNFQVLVLYIGPNVTSSQ